MIIFLTLWSSLSFFSCSIKKYSSLPPEIYWSLFTVPSFMSAFSFFVSLVLVLLNFDSTPRSVGPVLGGHPGWSVLRAPGTRQSSLLVLS